MEGFRLYAAIGAVILLAALTLGSLLTIAVLLAAALGLSFVINKFKLRILGAELVTFVAVLAGFAYGPLVGAFIALVLIIFHLVVSGYSGAYFAWVIPEYPAAAYFASTMAGQSIVSVGLTLTIGINLVNLFFTALVYRHNMGKFLPYAITNAIFNGLLFMAVGEAFVKLLG